ncbi:HAD-IIIA family hydrolase [Desulfothermus okinawensis JCM 13304]
MNELVERIKILISDVDGVLTDGGLYYDDQGRVFKKFNVQDGLGVKLAQMAGLEIIIITGLKSEAVKSRLKQLGIKEYYQGFIRKDHIIRKISKEKELNFEQMAYLGDDWVDAPAMKLVGFPMAVKNAQPEIKKIAKWISQKKGGEGALREAINFILSTQGKLEQLWEKWLNENF